MAGAKKILLVEGDADKSFFQKICKNLSLDIPTPKFPAHLTSKAEVATWLAWQKQPGHGLYAVIKDQLLDYESPLFKELERWLLNVFAKQPEQ